MFEEGGIGVLPETTDFNLQTTSILFENSVLPTRFAKGVKGMSLPPARHAPGYFRNKVLQICLLTIQIIGSEASNIIR